MIMGHILMVPVKILMFSSIALNSIVNIQWQHKFYSKHTQAKRYFLC